MNGWATNRCTPPVSINKSEATLQKNGWQRPSPQLSGFYTRCRSEPGRPVPAMLEGRDPVRDVPARVPCYGLQDDDIAAECLSPPRFSAQALPPGHGRAVPRSLPGLRRDRLAVRRSARAGGSPRHRSARCRAPDRSGSHRGRPGLGGSAGGRRLLASIEPAATRAQEAALAVLPPAKRKQFLALLNDFLRGHDAIIDPSDVMAGKPFGSQFDALISSRPAVPRASPRRRPVR